MNKFAYGVLAGAFFAAPGHATENEWLSLDREIEALSSSLSQTGGGPEWYGWIRSSWRDSSDLSTPDTSPGAAVGDTNDVQGFQFDSVRLGVEGDVGGYGYRIEYDFGSSFGTIPGSLGGAGGLLDAYVNTMLGERVTLRMGNFRQPFLRSSLIQRDRLLFLDRSGLGETFAGRSLGLQLMGSFETVNWYLAGQNGRFDGQGDDYLFTGRVEIDLLGGGVADVEGAWGASDETALTAGVAVADEGALDDGLHIGVDAALTTGPFSASAELVDFDDGDDLATDLFGIAAPTIGLFGGTGDVSNTTPWNATVSYMFTDMYEAAVRYEDADDTDDTTAWSAVVNRYVQGHDIKVQVQYTTIDSDASATSPGDIDFWGVGLSLSF
jgi:hypothetical protein